MLCLALKVIRGLQVPMKQKVALAMVFLLGSWSVLASTLDPEFFAHVNSTLVAGIVRMALVYRTHPAVATVTETQPTPLTANVITATIENGLAILCACLPIYKPILDRVMALFSNIRTWHSSLLGSSREQAGTSKTTPSPGDSSTRRETSRNSYQKIRDDHTYTVKGHGGSDARDGSVSDSDYSLRTIQAKEASTLSESTL